MVGVEGIYGILSEPPGTFTAIAADYRHACALRTDQTIACWGAADAGAGTAPAGSWSGKTRSQ